MGMKEGIDDSRWLVERFYRMNIDSVKYSMPRSQPMTAKEKDLNLSRSARSLVSRFKVTRRGLADHRDRT